MKKKFLSLIMCSFFVFTLVAFFGVSVKAASGDVTETGVMQDTSGNNGVVYWAYTYNKSTGKASLNITGNGYMPNSSDQDWFQVQREAGCYIYSVTVGEGVKSIMSDAFAGEIYLQEVKLPSTLERIGANAFAGTAIKTFNVPAKVGYVDGQMFADSAVEQFTVDSRNQYYKSYGGDLYSKDMSTLAVVAPGKFSKSGYKFTIPSSVKEIGRYAFYGTKIESVTIPSNVKKIGKMAFAACKSLSSVTIENGVESLYDSVFLACDSLKEIHLPKSVVYLGYYSLGYRYGVAFDDLAKVLDDANISHGQLNTANYQYYSELAGYDANAFYYCYADSSFSLYALKGSVGEKYAKDYGLRYIKSSGISSATNSYTGVLLTFNYSEEVLCYNLYKKTNNGAWQFVANIDGAQTTYTDTKVQSNTDYTYAVEVIYYTDGKSFDTGGAKVHYVKAPVLKSVWNDVNGIRVDWNTQNGAKYYYIYRKAPGQTGWYYLTSVPGTSSFYIDKSVKYNQKYSYTVRAHDGKALSSWNSQGVSCTFVKNPTFSVLNKPSNVTVRWNAPSVADFYNVYRRTNNGSWVLIGRAPANKRTFEDTTAVKGVLYRYTVRSSYNGCLSGYYYSGTPLKCLETPSLLKAENRVSGVTVTWKKSIGAEGYNIYRRVAGGNWTRIASVKGANTLSYLDTTAVGSGKYSYTVIGVSGSYLSGFDDTGVYTNYLSAPKITSAVSGKYGIKLNFTEAKGCQGYYIYRRSVNGSWFYIGKTENCKSTSFTDKTAKKGQTYVYTVRAYNGKYLSSFYQNGKTIKDVY